MKSVQEKYTSNSKFQKQYFSNKKQSSDDCQQNKKNSVKKFQKNSNSTLKIRNYQNYQSDRSQNPFQSQQNLNDQTQIFYFSNLVKKIIIKKSVQKKKQNRTLTITRIITQGKISAAFDNQKNVWLLGQIFPSPINLSKIVNKKIIDAYLSERFIVVKTKKKIYFINWDRIDVPKQYRKRIQVDQQYSQLFQCWEQVTPYDKDVWYCFLLKQNACQKKCCRVQNQKIIVYPLLQEINISKTIKGISSSKTHTLCWTACGKLFSWGQRSLGTGHYKNFCDDKIKQRQIQSVKFQVVSAVAGNNYSVALSSEGQIFQWGIKKVWNKKTCSVDQIFIFQPRKLEIMLDNKLQKICCLKGNQDNFGVLTLTNQLFVWGRSIPKKLMEFQGHYKQTHDQTETPSLDQVKKNIQLFQPTLCKSSLNVKIIDFEIGQDCVFLVTGSKQSILRNIESGKFWQKRLQNISGVVKNIQALKYEDRNSVCMVSQSIEKQEKQEKFSLTKLKKNKFHGHKRHKSAQQFQSNYINIQQTQKFQRFKAQLSKRKTINQTKLQKAVKQKISKEEYFKRIKNGQDICLQIMQGSQKSSFRSIQRKFKIPTEHYMLPVRNSIDYIKFQHRKKMQTLDLRFSETQKQALPKSVFRSKMQTLRSTQNQQQVKKSPVEFANIRNTIKNSPIKLQKLKIEKFKQKILQIKKNQDLSTQESQLKNFTDRSASQVYKTKLKRVLSRKQMNHQQFFMSILKKIQRSSITFKKKTLEDQTARKQKQKQKQIVKQTIFKFLIKNFVVKCLIDPIQSGRQQKIRLFERNLKFCRVQNSIKRLFCQNRIKFDVQFLKQNLPKNFLKLLIIYRNYVKQWKESKRKKLKNFCVEQLIRILAKKKMKVGLKNVKVSVQNLESIGSWLRISKQQKVKCLNQMWKSYIFTIFPTKLQFSGQYKKTKQEPMKSFKQLYSERIKINPMLKIQNYLGVSPLFKVKMFKNCSKKFMQMILKKKEIFHSNYLKKDQLKSSVRNKKQAKSIKQSNNSKQNTQLVVDINFILSDQMSYLLPYSSHSMIFLKPLKFELNINIRNQQCSQQQRSILVKVFQKYIKNFYVGYEKKLSKYRQQMAIFIRENFGKINQRRSKYILEYNQLKKTRNQREVRFKERQLMRVLETIGCENILQGDILPQKHRILDEASLIPGAPQPPSMWIDFSPAEFKKLFKEYFTLLQENLQMKKAQLKKNF